MRSHLFSRPGGRADWLTRVSVVVSCLGLACSEPPPGAGDTDDDESSTQADTETSENPETSGDGDGDGDGEAPVPENLPAPSGTCPSFAAGDVTFSPSETLPRTVKLWVGDDPQPGGMLVIYWHAYGSIPNEAEYTLSSAVIGYILDSGGVVAAPYPADDIGEAGGFPWFVVNNSPRPDDMLLGDEIVACAIEQVGIDPRRIHATGMSAGGLQTVAYTMARSHYIASVTSFSGGSYTTLPFEDPDNHFAAMIIHGGDNDIFGNLVHFDTLSVAWYNQLVANGNFAFICDHGGGHSIPSGYGPSVANFFFMHPFGTEPSPYAGGLPSGFPPDCSL
jgi:predicted esterase